MVNTINNKALTLVELVVASMISTVVIFGLFTIMQAVQNSSSTYGVLNYNTGSVQATVNHIIRNASTVTGTVGAPGIVLNGANQSFCLGQEGATIDSLPDTWICYTQVGNNIHTCTSNSSTTQCTASQTFIGSADANCIKDSGSPCTTTGVNPIWTGPGQPFTITISNTVNGKTISATGSVIPSAQAGN